MHPPTGVSEMLQRRKPLLDGGRDRDEREHVGKVEVAHDCAAHDAAVLVVAAHQ